MLLFHALLEYAKCNNLWNTVEITENSGMLSLSAELSLPSRRKPQGQYTAPLWNYCREFLFQRVGRDFRAVQQAHQLF